jgi:hypothetical protein
MTTPDLSTYAGQAMTRDDHELMRLIRARVNQNPPIPMSQIAAELGVDIDELCAFIMAYKEPRQRKAFDNRSYGPPIARVTPGNVDHWSQPEQAQRFLNWRRARDGAAQARRQP